MNSWLDDLLLSVLRFIGAFFAGRPVLGPATSDAAFWRRGTETTRRRWPANTWSLRPHWQRAVARLAVIVAVVALWRWQWVAVVVLALLVAAELGYLLWRKPWRDDPAGVITRFDPGPLFDGVRPVLGIADGDSWHDWIGVSEDIDRPDRVGPVYLRLPDNWTQSDPRHDHVASVVAHHLPGDWTPVWYLDGYVEFHPLPEQSVTAPVDASPGQLSGAAPTDGPLTDDGFQQSHDMASYAPPEIDPLLLATGPIVIDGEQADRDPRRSR